jgi:integrase
MSLLAPTLQAFFTDRLLTQRQASPRTVAAYRDTLRLLLDFAQQRIGTPPCRLDLADLDAELVAAFLTHLERDRSNGVRTRNARLAAVHSLFRYAALRHPEHAELIARVLAIPANATTAHWSASSPRPRWTRFSPRPTGRPGSGAVITPCWSWPSRPGCESANSPRSPSLTCASATARTRDATVRAARSAPPR